jgi:hypothetical protein
MEQGWMWQMKQTGLASSKTKIPRSLFIRRLAELRGLVLKFDRPTDPADAEKKVPS